MKNGLLIILFGCQGIIRKPADPAKAYCRAPERTGAQSNAAGDRRDETDVGEQLPA